MILLVCFGSSLLPVDVALGNTKYATEFVQGTPYKHNLKTNKQAGKKVKKKKRSWKYKWTSKIIDYPVEWLVMGYTQTKPAKPFELNSVQNIFDSVNYIAKVRLANNTKHKELPREDKDEHNEAFLIPAASAARRKKASPGKNK